MGQKIFLTQSIVSSKNLFTNHIFLKIRNNSAITKTCTSGWMISRSLEDFQKLYFFHRLEHCVQSSTRSVLTYGLPFGNGDSILLRHAAMGWANNPITRYCIQLIKTGLTELRCLTATLVPVLKKADAKQIAKPTNGFKPYITFRQLGLLFLPWFSFRAAIIFPGLLSLCQHHNGLKYKNTVQFS